MRYCTQCGHPIPEHARFCEQCGQVVEADGGDSSAETVGDSSSSSADVAAMSRKRRLVWVALLAFALIVVASTTHVNVVSEQTPYPTTRTDDNSLWKGDEKVTVVGQQGERFHRSVAVLGMTSAAGNWVAREPVAEVIAVGTKPRDVSGSFTELPDGDFMVSFGEQVDGVVVTNLAVGDHLDPSTNEAATSSPPTDNTVCLSFEAHAMKDGASAPSISLTVSGPGAVSFGPSPTLSATRQSRCGFSIKKPASGWVAGTYYFDVLVNGKSAHKGSFNMTSPS